MKKLIDVPKKFHNMLQSKKDAKQSETDFTFIPPSGQFWNGLSEKEQGELRQLVATEGEDLEDYLHEMRKMLPFTPKGR